MPRLATTSSARQHIPGGMVVSDQPDHGSAFFGDNEMKLGTFCLNISGGMMMSTAAKNTLDWREEVPGAPTARSAGSGVLLPLRRWCRQAGTNNHNDDKNMQRTL